MEKKEIKEEIWRILALDVEDLPKKKERLYVLSYLLFLTIQSVIASCMVHSLSKKWSFFSILGVLYLFLTVTLLIFARSKVGKK